MWKILLYLKQISVVQVSWLILDNSLKGDIIASFFYKIHSLKKKKERNYFKISIDKAMDFFVIELLRAWTCEEINWIICSLYLHDVGDCSSTPGPGFLWNVQGCWDLSRDTPQKDDE